MNCFNNILCLLIVIFFVGCKNNENTPTVNTESQETDSVKDSNFESFIFSFMTNNDFQLSRTKIANWKYYNYFENRDYSTYFFPTLVVPDNAFGNDISDKICFTILNPDVKTKVVLIFNKTDDNWYLSGKEETEFITDSVIDFETFLYRFSADTIFQKKHTLYPLKNTSVDYENDYAIVTEYLDSDKVSACNFFDEGEFEYFQFNPSENSQKMTVCGRGLDNGISFNYCFEKRKNEWVMIETADYSD
jgi:hypothetical protein